MPRIVTSLSRVAPDSAAGRLEMLGTPWVDPDTRALLNEIEHNVPNLHWQNALEHGLIRDLTHLRTLLTEVGTEPAWQFLIVHTPDHSAWVQACGSADDVQLAVEVKWDTDPVLVVPTRAARAPRFNIGLHGWEYWAALEELHPVGPAFGIFADWLIDRHLDQHRFELRTTIRRIGFSDNERTTP